jgi:hypothetical protein
MRQQYTVNSLPFIYNFTRYENHYYRKSGRQTDTQIDYHDDEEQRYDRETIRDSIIKANNSLKKSWKIS